MQDVTVEELLQTAEAVAKLSQDPVAFREAHGAFDADNAPGFQAALAKVGLTDLCPIICGFFCTKCCIAIGRKFCSGPKKGKSDADEMFACAKAFGSVFQDEATVTLFIKLMAEQDVEGWNAVMKKYNLEAFCYEICVLVCSRHCKKKCGALCQPSAAPG
jgi:hypothetical protein